MKSDKLQDAIGEIRDDYILSMVPAVMASLFWR